jgi:hypothetical protein
MTRRLGAVLIALLLAFATGCDGGDGEVATQPRPTTSPESGEAALEEAVRSALDGNRRLSVFVLWNNRIPAWAQVSTRGPALGALRAAAQNRKERGVRVRVLASRREVRSLRLDPSYVTATAIVVDRQRVQPSRRNGRPLGHEVRLNERARYELRRVGESDRFVVWRVVLL